MSDPHPSDTAPQWGRPLKRKVKYAAPSAAGTAAPHVGPVDDPAALAQAATIVHTEHPPRPVSVPAPRAHREPDESDFRLRDLVGTMAKGLVDHPDDVVVEILSAGDDGVFELHVHPDDLGHVIGKQGRTARSLRLTLGAAAARADRRVTLEIAD
ncbi:MAG TPA: KH domain-containing protein [Candidatus Acidoferrales bacterium]|nr:KH domain-containing protein [Candidatus Acidoferrales bacterium]